MKVARFLALLGLAGVFAFGATVTLDNGVSGVGGWEVIVDDAGSSATGNLTHAGGTNDVIYSYRNSVVIGSGGPLALSGTTTAHTTQNGLDQAQSGGSFGGQNGSISWIATSWINPGSAVLTTRFDFNSTDPFGSVRFFNYLDEDVLSAGANNLIVFGSAASNDLQLLTVHDTQNLGVAQAASYQPLGATFAGWGAHVYGSGHDYDISFGGNTTAPLLGGGDLRYPGQVAFGTTDMISVLGFDLSPTATSASITLSLGGSPTGAPISATAATPEPGSIVLLSSGLAGAAFLRRKLAR